MFAKLTALQAELGTLNALIYAADRALRLLSRNRASLSYLHLMAQNVRVDSILPDGRGSSIIVREVTVDDIEQQHWACGRDLAKARVSRGIIGLLAFLRDRCVGYIWISLGNYQDELLPIEFVPAPAGASAWSLDLFIHPDHRRSFAFPRLWAAVFALMRERQLAWMMSGVSATNRLSIASHESLGAVRVGSVAVLVFGRLAVVLQPRKPRLTMAWARRPQIIVQAPIKEA